MSATTAQQPPVTQGIKPGTMPVAEHIHEARRRGTCAVLALVAAIIAGYLLSDQILDLLRAPVTELAETRSAALNYDSITGAFNLKLRIALITGVALSAPVMLYQLMRFLNPALTRKERGFVCGFLIAALPLFTAGAGLGLWIFPTMVQSLAQFSSAEDSTLLSASYYVDFALKIVVATGVAFLLPVLVVLANVAGLLSAAAIARGWRISLVVIVIFSALATPAADIVSMLVLASVLAGLFVISWGIAAIHDRYKHKRSHQQPLEEGER